MKRKPVDDDAESSSGDEGNESDRELQIALEKGLLKSDRLNYVTEAKRPLINNQSAMLAKVAEFKSNLEWVERMDVTVSRDNQDAETGPDPEGNAAADNDFEREILFYKQAQQAVAIALPRLAKLGMPVFRPADYYAEMAKSDQHMTKVRRKLLEVQQGKERQEASRRMRDEKKFASKVQKEVLAGRQNEKKKLLEAVKKHRKGMTAQLDEMLNNARNIHSEKDDDKPLDRKTFPKKGVKGGPKSRKFRDKQYGFGGQKKRGKRNDSTSYDQFSVPGMKAKKSRPSTGSGKAKGGGKGKGKKRH